MLSARIIQWVERAAGPGAAPSLHGRPDPTIDARVTMSKRDYYEVLGVGKTAGEAELKSAFRKLAMQRHPDRNPGDKDAEIKFKEINEAYQVLTDAQKRAAYDRFGHAAFEQWRRGPAASATTSPTSMSDIFEDFFGDMMARRGAARRRARARRRPALQHGDHARGGLPRQDARRSGCRPRSPARPAAGSGAKAGSKPKTCATCGGHGRVRARAGLLLDRAHLPELPRPRRDHRRSVPELRRRRAASPASARCRSTFRPASRTAPASGSPARARRAARRPAGRPLHLPVDQAASLLPARRRRPLSAACRSRWSRRRSAASSTCRRSTASDAKVKVPEGTQSGKQFRLKGKGMPVLRSRDVGDLYIQVVVETPQNLTGASASCWRSSTARSSKETQPGERRLLRPREGILRRPRRQRPALSRRRPGLNFEQPEDRSGLD